MKRVLLTVVLVLLVLGAVTGIYSYLHGDPEDPRRLQGRAVLGDAEAQFRFAQKLAEGDGVPENDREALKWYREAAEKGHPRAALTMSRLYFTGDGVARDDAKGAEWMQRAAERGDSYAQALMGMLCLGGIGVPQDPRAALMWLNRSNEDEAVRLYGILKAEIAAIDALPAPVKEGRMEQFFAEKKAAISKLFEKSIRKTMQPGETASQEKGEENGR